MNKAAFSIIGYKFDKVLIDLSNHNHQELSLSFQPSGVYDKKASVYELIFVVKVFNKEHDNEPFVSIRCRGAFQFENISSFDQIPDFFYKNSIAILFPYVRSYLSLVTNQANVPGIILPTLNLSSLEHELRKNTSQK